MLLEDVAILMSLPFFGQAHATGATLKEEDQKKVEYLTKFLSSSKYSTNNATQILQRWRRKGQQVLIRGFPSLLALAFHLSVPAERQPS